MGIREETKIREEFMENTNSLSRVLLGDPKKGLEGAPKDKWIILTRKKSR